MLNIKKYKQIFLSLAVAMLFLIFLLFVVETSLDLLWPNSIIIHYSSEENSNQAQIHQAQIHVDTGADFTSESFRSGEVSDYLLQNIQSLRIDLNQPLLNADNFKLEDSIISNEEHLALWVAVFPALQMTLSTLARITVLN